MHPIEDSFRDLAMRVWRMRTAIKIDLTETDRQALTAIVTDRNSAQKLVWRAQIVLLSADGCGTMELTRHAGTSRTYDARRPLRAAPPARGVHPFPERHRGRRSTRQGDHAIVDNYATHKHPKVREWLERHPRWTFHFIPTSASWLNAVEGYFAKLAKRRLLRRVFRSVVELQIAIKRFLAEINADPRPFRWTKDPGRINAAVKRGHQVLILSTRIRVS